MNKVQKLFNKLVEEYKLRAIKIEGETWYALNDLPLTPVSIRKSLERLRNSAVTLSHTQNFEQDNTKLIKNSDVISSDTRNFDTELNNFGEKFGNYKIINYLIMSSRLGVEYKVGLIEILDQIRTEGYYIDENATQEQLDKATEELERLRGEIKKGNGGFDGTTYKTIERFAKEWNNKENRDIVLNEEMILEIMKDKKWLDKDYNISKNCSYGHKLMSKGNKYYLSPKAWNLLTKHLGSLENDYLLALSKQTSDQKPF